jgi:hypothetical protein
MKKLLLILLCVPMIGFGQNSWSSSQIKKASTANHINYLTDIEKEAITYINLARLFPKDFVQNELIYYSGPEGYVANYLENSSYKRTLISHLERMKPVKALYFDASLFENAKCFARESGIKGTRGHIRVTCTSMNGRSEVCSYGMYNGRDIAMQWLIDHDVPSLGHRVSCLNSSYNKIGLSVHDHKKYQTCAVAEIK